MIAIYAYWEVFTVITLIYGYNMMFYTPIKDTPHIFLGLPSPITFFRVLYTLLYVGFVVLWGLFFHPIG